MQGSYLGPSFNDNEIEKTLNDIGAIFNKLSEENLLKIIAQELSQEKNYRMVSRKNGIWP